MRREGIQRERERGREKRTQPSSQSLFMVTACASLVFHHGVTNRMSVNVPMERGSSQNTCVRIVVIRAFSDSLAGTLTHTYRHNQSREREKERVCGGMVRCTEDMDCLCACVDISAAAACVLCIPFFMCSLCVCVCVCMFAYRIHTTWL